MKTLVFSVLALVFFSQSTFADQGAKEHSYGGNTNIRVIREIR